MGGGKRESKLLVFYISGTTMEVFIHKNRRHSTMVQCLETVQDNIGVNIGVNASKGYAMYGDGDSDSDRVWCFK